MLVVVVVTVITAAIVVIVLAVFLSCGYNNSKTSTPQLFCNPNSPLGTRHAIWLLAFAQIPHLYVYLLPLFGVTRWAISTRLGKTMVGLMVGL